MKHVIPDIHGQVDKLDGLLAHLGWRRTPAGWSGPDLETEIVFLGDFIDRGPNNAATLARVRSLVDAGKARAVLGNHEFNAICFHTWSEGQGGYLRPHSEKNIGQHRCFLDEFPPLAAPTREAIDWMKTLPLFLEADGLRAVHACWHGPSVARIVASLAGARLTDDLLHDPRFADTKTEGGVRRAVELVTKGVERRLPAGYAIRDEEGNQRPEVRIAWLLRDETTWRGLARSVRDLDELPDGEAPEDVLSERYDDTVPVFFGHYWLNGVPVVEADHALCLDYSAGAA